MSSSRFLSRSAHALAARVLRDSFGVQCEQPLAERMPRLGAVAPRQVVDGRDAGADFVRQLGACQAGANEVRDD